MEEIGRQLKKGVMEILVLKLLSLQEMYGYQIIQELDAESGGVFRMKEGTLYPILYRLEDGKLIESYWEQDNEKRGVPRKYYRITREGILGLQGMNREWQVFASGVNAILQKEGNENG